MKTILKIISFILTVCIFISVFCVQASSATPVFTSRNDFLWGVNIHPTSYPDYNLDPELYVKASAGLGVQTIRVNIGADLHDFSYIDRIVALCSSYNLKIIACVGLSDDLDYNREYYEKLARRYDGKGGYGFIDYYEIGGEEEIPLLNKKNNATGKVNTGDYISHYYLDDVKTLQNKYASAIEGVKNSGTTAKTVIDFSHLHYAPLLYMYQNGLDFDIIGIDWYTNMGSISKVLTPVMRYFPHDIMITETNLWSYSTTNFNNLSEYNLLFDFMNTSYATNRVKGLIFYELMDEPIFESQNNGNFHTESHFGLIYSLNENSVKPKPIYTYLQSVLGGGTVTPEPVIAKEVKTVLDMQGTHLTFAHTAQWYYHYLGDWHSRENVCIADFTESEFLDLDIKIGNYDEFRNTIDNYGLSMWFRVSSGENRYANSSAAYFNFNDLTPLGNGWYHLRLSMDRFTRNENGNIDWSAVKNWQFFIEGGNEYEVGSLYSMDFCFRNICGVSPKPDMPKNCIPIDEEGKIATVGPYYQYLWDRLCKATYTTLDLSAAEFIEFDISYSDREVIRAAEQKNGYVLTFNLTSSGSQWQERSVVGSIFNFETYSKNGWYHYVIPKNLFSIGADWSAIDLWMFGFNGGNNVLTGEIQAETINVRNICGTVYSLKSDIYTVKDGYTFVEKGTDVQTVSNAFVTGADIYNGTELLNSGRVATGMKAVISNGNDIYDSASIIVKNDIFADGYVNANDLTLLKKYLFDSVKLSDIQKMALCGRSTATPDIRNYINIKKEILGIS